MPGTDLLLARILSPLARSLDEARRHLELSPETQDGPAAERSPAFTPAQADAAPAPAFAPNTPAVPAPPVAATRLPHGVPPLTRPHASGAPDADAAAAPHASQAYASAAPLNPAPHVSPHHGQGGASNAQPAGHPLTSGAAAPTSAPGPQLRPGGTGLVGAHTPAPAAPAHPSPAYRADAAPLAPPGPHPGLTPNQAAPAGPSPAPRRWRRLPMPVLPPGTHDSYDFRPLPLVHAPEPAPLAEAPIRPAAPRVMAAPIAPPAPQAIDIPAPSPAPGPMPAPVSSAVAGQAPAAPSSPAPRPDVPQAQEPGTPVAAPEMPGAPQASNLSAPAPLRLQARPRPLNTLNAPTIASPSTPQTPAPTAQSPSTPWSTPTPASAARLGAVDRALTPVLDQAWQMSHQALLAEESPDTSSSAPGAPASPAPDSLVPPGGPRINNHFHVNVAVDGRGANGSADDPLFEERLVGLLRDAARRQGLDV